MVSLNLCILNGQSCSSTSVWGCQVSLNLCVRDGQGCRITAVEGCQVTLSLCILVCQSCSSSTAVEGCQVSLNLCILDGQSCSSTSVWGCYVSLNLCVLLMVRLAVNLYIHQDCLLRDVRLLLNLCIPVYSCFVRSLNLCSSSSTAVEGCQVSLNLCILDGQSCSSTSVWGCQVSLNLCVRWFGLQQCCC